MQTVDPGRSIVGCHDGSEYPLGLGDGSRSRVRDVDVLFCYGVGLLVEACLGVVAHALLQSAWPRGVSSFERVAQADAERVFLVGELIDEVTGVVPKRKIRVGFGSVEGRACALLVVVVQQMGCAVVPLAC